MTSPVNLQDLLPELCIDTPIFSIASDSRKVVKSGLFLAVQGLTSHGLDFIEQVVMNGASMVLWQPSETWNAARVDELECDVMLLPVEDLAKKVSEIARRFYHFKQDILPVIGITGTNGKSSCAYFIAQALGEKKRCAVVGTLGNGFIGHLIATTHTTPDAMNVQSLLADFRQNGAEIVAMEVSSHALDQGRVDNVAFETAILTNLTRDHLDYHKTLEAYAKAKMTLFQMPDLKRVMLNMDDDFGRRLALQIHDCRILGYSIDASLQGMSELDGWVKVLQIKYLADMTQIVFDSTWGKGQFETSLLGRFNIRNLLVVLLVLLEQDVELTDACQRLSTLSSIEGRMQVFRSSGKPSVVVDFAHTPDALIQSLQALREYVGGKLICVFGCGGDRDQGKRPLMGRAAQQYADQVWITSDNPRSESVELITQHILSGMQCADQVHVELDRKQAIIQALDAASAQDWVLIAGKGHEQYQLIADQKLPFSDQSVAQQALARWCA